MAIGTIGRGFALTPKVLSGARRLGRPRTARFGTSKLPRRGTGLARAFNMVKARRRGE